MVSANSKLCSLKVETQEEHALDYCEALFLCRVVLFFPRRLMHVTNIQVFRQNRRIVSV